MMKPRTFEEILRSEGEKLDHTVLDQLERRAKKRLIAHQAIYIQREEETLQTLRQHCDAIMLAATGCIQILQAMLQPQYKPYIEYLISVANTGCFQPHETVFFFIENALLRQGLPEVVVKFIRDNAVQFIQTARMAAQSATVDYLKIMEKIQADIKSKLDQGRHAKFIRVFDELFFGLKRVAGFQDPELFIQCFNNVKLSIGIATDPPVDVTKMEQMTSLIVDDAVDKGWLGFVGKFLRGLDKLNAQYGVLLRYSRQQQLQNCEQEIGLPNLTLK